MSYSLNEIAAFSKRAARGAGLPWGLAEEAAMAARWLAAFDLPGVEVLADLLVCHEGAKLAQVSPNISGDIWQGQAWLSPLTTGPALSDRASLLADTGLADTGSIRVLGITHPLLLLPFVANAAQQIGSPVSMTWDGVVLTSDGVNLSAKADKPALKILHQVNVVCRVNAAMPNPVTPKFRGHMSDGCLAALTALAEKSFAPATEASRKLGAGADQSDSE